MHMWYLGFPQSNPIKSKFLNANQMLKNSLAPWLVFLLLLFHCFSVPHAI